MQNKHICITSVLFAGFMAVGAEEKPLQLTQEAFLDRLGVNAQSIADTKVGTFLKVLANTERILNQNETHTPQADFYACALSRTINAYILNNKYGDRHHRVNHGALIGPNWTFKFSINLNSYYADPELPGDTHRDMQLHTGLYDWLIEFRKAQRKNAALCEQAQLYVTLRQLFIAADDTRHAALLEAPDFNQSDPFDAFCIRNRARSLKKSITEFEQSFQNDVRRIAERDEIAAAFKALTENNS